MEGRAGKAPKAKTAKGRYPAVLSSVRPAECKTTMSLAMPWQRFAPVAKAATWFARVSGPRGGAHKPVDSIRRPTSGPREHVNGNIASPKATCRQASTPAWRLYPLPSQLPQPDSPVLAGVACAPAERELRLVDEGLLMQSRSPLRVQPCQTSTRAALASHHALKGEEVRGPSEDPGLPT